MVALLLRLRFRILANTLSRNPWQLIAVVLGGIAVLPVLPAVLAGALQTSTFDPGTPLVIAGSLVVLGWAVVPIFVGGVEHTLDPVRLARFPLRPRTIMTAGVLVGATWIPGVLTILGGLLYTVAWHAWPVVIPVAVLCVLAGALTAILFSRAVSALAEVLLLGRRRVVRIAVVAGMVVVLIAPAAVAVAIGVLSSNTIFDAALWLGWTPLGAVWAIPDEVAVLFYTPGALENGWLIRLLGSIGVEAVTVAGLVAVWRLALGAALVRGAGAGAGARRASGSDRLGVFALVPSTPIGAIAARSVRYWTRDPRYARQLVAVIVMPAMFLLWAKVSGFAGIGVAAGPTVAALLPLAIFAGISYDGTAFAANLIAGVRGVHDRIGRAIGLLAVALPLVIGIQFVVIAVLDRWANAPAVLGMTIGVMLTALAVVSISSARIVVPVPRAGRNPFSASAGAGATSIGASYAVTGITAALALPELVLGILAAATGSALLGWIALATGAVVGSVLLVAGIRIGGAILDARGPEVLARLRVLR